MLGGTFDYLHTSHKLLIFTQLLLTRVEAVIGLTSEEMLKNKKNKEYMQSYSGRRRMLEFFIETVSGKSKNVRIVEIKDPVGPAGEGEYDGLILSDETRKGGEYVNSFRK